MTTDKDPQVEHPGRPDPAPGPDGSDASSEGTKQQGRAATRRGDRQSDAGVKPELDTQNEADEPIENRFPDDVGGEHRESG